MHYKPISIISYTVCCFFILQILSCSKSSPDVVPPSSDVCAGKTIIVTATATVASACASTGSISASATGSTGFTFKLNSLGAYQASGSFNNLPPATYTIFAKDAPGCEKSQVIIVSSAGGSAGTKFTAVKNLIAAKCQLCHGAARQEGGMNFSVDCNIVQFQARIKSRAVDIGDMPQGGPLSAGEKAVITDWINAGGTLSN